MITPLEYWLVWAAIATFLVCAGVLVALVVAGMVRVEHKNNRITPGNGYDGYGQNQYRAEKVRR